MGKTSPPAADGKMVASRMQFLFLHCPALLLLLSSPKESECPHPFYMVWLRNRRSLRTMLPAILHNSISTTASFLTSVSQGLFLTQSIILTHFILFISVLCSKHLSRQPYAVPLIKSGSVLCKASSLLPIHLLV